MTAQGSSGEPVAGHEDATERAEPGTTFGTFHLGFLFIPKLRLLDDGLYLIRRKQKKLWSDIRSVTRLDAGIWILAVARPLGSYVRFRDGSSVWISAQILSKQRPLSAKHMLWSADRTKGYDVLIGEIMAHVNENEVSVYAPGRKHERIANTIRSVLILALLAIFIWVLIGLFRR